MLSQACTNHSGETISDNRSAAPGRELGQLELQLQGKAGNC